MSAPRTEDLLHTLEVTGLISDEELALKMGITADDVWTRLHNSLHRGEISLHRGPNGQRMLSVTPAGTHRVSSFDLELVVLDVLDCFGPRSALDLSTDLTVGPELDEVLAKLTFGSWITGYEPTQPDGTLAITERGRRRLTATIDRGRYESEWR